MRYHQNILCLESFDYIRTLDNPEGLVPEGTYKSQQQRGTIIIHGKGGNGRGILIEFESLPEMYKRLVLDKYGDPYEYMAKQPIRNLIALDMEAKKFFDGFELPDGSKLDGEDRKLYTNSASIMKAFSNLLADKRELKKVLNISIAQFWNTACTLVQDKDITRRFPHNLPHSERRLKPLYNQYVSEGYTTFIDQRIFNVSNNKKVDDKLERLILSLYILNNKPYARDVATMYEQFLYGQRSIVDYESGEIFNAADFHKDGEPVTLGDTTVWRYINKPVNRITVDKIRLSALQFASKHRPHMHRHAPQYSFSKITMDDISIPFKMHDGKRAWAYQVFDVASGCVIGKAFARSNEEGSGKNRSLLMQCVLDMFRTCVKNGWGVPAEIEVEQHISNTFSEDLLKEGDIFPFVTFCRGANPQQKRAENMIRGKKYGVQKDREGFQFRPFSRLEANRMNEDKNTVRYSFEEIVANETADIETWNNSEHPKFPGCTRWEVLCNNINPQLSEPDMAFLAKYIGLSTGTSIQRNQYVIVKHNKYCLPSPAIIEQLSHYQVTAYYMPDADGCISQVHLYQDDEFLCTCGTMETYNEARVERTDADETIMHKQFGYRQSFDSLVKTNLNALTKVRIMRDEPAHKTPVMAEKTPVKRRKEADKMPVVNPINWKTKALEDL